MAGRPDATVHLMRTNRVGDDWGDQAGPSPTAAPLAAQFQRHVWGGSTPRPESTGCLERRNYVFSPSPGVQLFHLGPAAAADRARCGPNWTRNVRPDDGGVGLRAAEATTPSQEVANVLGINEVRASLGGRLGRRPPAAG